FLNLSEAQRRLQPSSKPGQPRGTVTVALFVSGFNSAVHAIHGEADGVRELRAEQQELHNTVVAQIGCVGLAIRFKSRAGSKQSDPFEKITPLGSPVWVSKLPIVDLQELDRCGRALQVAAHLNEMPAFPMAHG